MRWGFLGASRIGRRALAPAVQEAGHELYAVAARDLARAEAFAAECGAARAYQGYDALLADPAIDAVYNALPNDAHLPWTLKALAAGKHVLCEKPLALSAAEVSAMRDASRRAGKGVMEAFCHVHHPQIDRVRGLLASGAVGGLVSLHCASGLTIEEADDFRWHAAQGGGALFDIGCYCVSLMRVLVGREPVRVMGIQAPRGEVDETFSGLLDFGGGLAGQFTCSFAAAKNQDLIVIGTRERLHLNWPISTKGRSTRLQLGEKVEEFPPMDPYVAMVRYFASSEDAYGLDWSLAQARVLDALFAAVRTGHTINVNPS